MKKYYTKPMISVVKINTSDIIATSTGGSTSGGQWGARDLYSPDSFDEFGDFYDRLGDV